MTKPRKQDIQCKACPWKKSTTPAKDIPGGYCETKHRNLKGTIASPGDIHSRPGTAMACHEAKVGAEYPCVGWVMHQLGVGNNLGLRMQALDGRFKNMRTVGPQHETFEATLGKSKEDDDDYVDWGDEEDDYPQ